MHSAKWLLVAVVLAVLATTGGLSGVAARTDSELDVAAIPLVPEDVDEPGFGLLGGMLIASVDEAAQIAAENRGGASPDNVAEFAGILEDVGWQRDYLVGLGLPSEENPDTYAVLIDSGVEEYADADGASESFEIFGDPEAFTSVQAEEVRRAPRLGDEARMVQFTGEIPEANLTFQGLSIQFRVDNLVAYVTVYDYVGGEPEADTVETLASRLLERVEAAQEADEPGASAAVLRLPGDSLAESSENYVRLAGETIPYFGEAADAQASRDEQYADVSDVYVLSQQVAAGEEDPADDPRYLVFLHRFDNERSASSWMETEQERLDLTAEDAPFRIAEAEGIGEESFAYETLPDRDTALERRYVLYTRAGADVAIMDLSAGSDVSFDALAELAEAQVDCLEAGTCPDPAPLPEELGVEGSGTEEETPTPEPDRERRPASTPVPTERADEEETPATEDETPTAESGVEGNAYTSPTYGYGLSWDADTWEVASEEVDEDGRDTLRLRRGETGFLSVEGVAEYDGDADACLEAVFDEQLGQLTDVQPATTAGGDPIEGGEEGTAFAAYTYTGVDREEEVERTVYVHCQTVIPGESVVLFTLITTSDAFPADLKATREMIASLELPSAAGNTPA